MRRHAVNSQSSTLLCDTQVLRRHYSKEADIWSCGVMLYILLCGVPPFWGETEQQIFDAILKGRLDFDSDPWPAISAEAKDCVKEMLQPVRLCGRVSDAGIGVSQIHSYQCVLEQPADVAWQGMAST